MLAQQQRRRTESTATRLAGTWGLVQWVPDTGGLIGMQFSRSFLLILSLLSPPSNRFKSLAMGAFKRSRAPLLTHPCCPRLRGLRALRLSTFYTFGRSGCHLCCASGHQNAGFWKGCGFAIGRSLTTWKLQQTSQFSWVLPDIPFFRIRHRTRTSSFVKKVRPTHFCLWGPDTREAETLQSLLKRPPRDVLFAE